MTAREELVRALNGQILKCAQISYVPDGIYSSLEIDLPVGYTEEEYNQFLDALNFTYDSGYGMQHLYGILWCENGVWFDRYEYDGSECWSIHKYPVICEQLSQGNRLTINHPKHEDDWYEEDPYRDQRESEDFYGTDH